MTDTYTLKPDQTGASEVRIAGWRGSCVVVEDVSGDFAAPYLLTPREAVEKYGINPHPPQTEAEALRERDQRLQADGVKALGRKEGSINLGALRDLMRRNGRSEQSPEDVFAAEAESDDG